MKYLFMVIIRLYQKLLSPILGARCRFYPSCSAYSYTAFERFGFFRGMYLTVWRLIRCNPYNIGGIDPVPEQFCFRPDKHKEHIEHNEHNEHPEHQEKDNKQN